MNKFKNNWWLLLPIIAVYIVGMFNDVMEPDAAQYAVMSMEMLETGNFLEIYYRGADYIDKPPLIFWLSVLSYKLIGVSNFSYKLPSVLFMLLSLYTTYRLAKKLYNERIGYYSVLVLGTCQAWFMINQDVKTDNILVSCTLFAIWQLVEFNTSKKIIHILGASLGIAGAMLTKGPIGILVPALALATDFILKRQWNKFLQWQWMVLILLVLICLLPMLVGLYHQFDLSNGKETYNGKITSGLRFYFWTQSFGRITGESRWKNNSDPIFFVHTFLWSFLPWCIIFLVALWKQIKKIIKQKFLLSVTEEGITVGGIIFPFIAFSLSLYKLPHYIFVIFPLVAILTGVFLFWMIDEHRYKRHFRSLAAIQVGVSVILIALILVLCIYAFPMNSIVLWILTCLGIIIWFYFVFTKGEGFQKIIMPSFIAIVLVNLLLNAHVYPQLLTFQSASVAGHKVRNDANLQLIGYQEESFALDFYYRKYVTRVESVVQLVNEYPGKELWVYTHEKGYKQLQMNGFITETNVLPKYHITKLKSKFLNPRTRPKEIDHMYLLKVKVPQG